MLKLKKISKGKGQISQLAILIIILMSAIVIFLFITKFTSKSTFDQAVTACRMSVITQYATEFAPTLSGKKSPFDINCDKRYVQFSNTNVKLGLSLENMKTLPIFLEGKKVSRFGSLNDFVVNQVLAEELRVCKFQFADGRIEVFGNDEEVLSDLRVCFACSEISFDPKVPKQTFNKLLDYTSKTKFDNTNITYYEYLAASSVINNTMWTQSEAELSIDTSKKYVVLFEKFDSAKVDILYKDGYWVMIIPIDKINDYCDIQAS